MSSQASVASPPPNANTPSEFTAKTFERTDYTNPTRFIWSQVRRHKIWAFVMLIGAASNALLAAIVPIFAGLALDRVIEDEDLGFVALMAVAIVGSQVVRGVLQFGRNFAMEVFAQRIERDVREELYVSLLGKSMTFHDMHPTGEIMARVTNDVREMNLMMNPGFNLIIGSSMFLLVPMLIAPTIHPTLIATPLLFIIGYVFVQWDYVRSLQEVAANVRKSFGTMNARMAETLDGIEVVKGSAQEDQEVRNLFGLIDRVRGYFVQQGDIEARYYALLLLGLANVFGFLHCVVLYEAGSIGAGSIVAFMGQLALFQFPVFTSVFTFSRVASGYAGSQRILDLINTTTSLDENAAGHAGNIEGRVQFEDVTFGYLPDRNVLHDVSFTIEPGETVAIVGQTGSGKTTLAKLMNRTYDTTSGTITVDGRDLREWQLASLRSQISIIEQEIFLFSRSITDNIRFGRTDATDDEVIEAAKNAQAHDFIMGFPDGYETVIGQRGITLSGGQRQRLAIARAFVTNPRILILDDSTSAIDSATEDLIQKAIWQAAKGRTTILITHRLSQIRWADKIIVVRNGRIAAQGKHEDLLQRSVPYRRIFANMEDRTTKTALPGGADGAQGGGE
jgi:ATP-binding cassette, subfamily B, bacterial